MDAIVSVKVEATNLIDRNSRENLKDFILELDSEMCEVDFTLELINELILSLANDGKIWAEGSPPHIYIED